MLPEVLPVSAVFNYTPDIIHEKNRPQRAGGSFNLGPGAGYFGVDLLLQHKIE